MKISNRLKACEDLHTKAQEIEIKEGNFDFDSFTLKMQIRGGKILCNFEHQNGEGYNLIYWDEPTKSYKYPLKERLISQLMICLIDDNYDLC